MSTARFVPLDVGPGLVDYAFGQGSGARINRPDNCLILFSSLKRSMDQQQIVLCPADATDSTLKTLKLHVTVDDAHEIRISENHRLGDLDGTELIFLNDNRPAAHFLYYHFAMTLFTCLSAAHNREKNYELLKSKPFMSFGPYMRRSVLVSLARYVYGMPPEYQEIFWDEDVSFMSYPDLSLLEVDEASRRLLRANLLRENEAVDHDCDEDDDDDVGDA